MPTYLITGASSGIGLELVKQLASEGNKVFVTCRKRQSSQSGKDAISEVSGDVTILEGIDVSSDDVGAALAASEIAGVEIDTIVHNAGSINGTREVSEGETVMSEQRFDVVTTDRMRAAFEVNTLGPLRVQQALMHQMKTPGGKIAIISTGLASIGDNSSGGIYAYRTSKAGVNIIAKSLSCDLKEKGISVMAIAPGFVATAFGPGKEAMAKMGAMPVDQSCRGIIKLLKSMNMENTGTFFSVQKGGEEVKEMPW